MKPPVMGGFYAVLPYLSKLTDFKNSLKSGEEIKMLTSDHTRYRVKYLKRFKGASPKIAVQRTITYLENTNHPLTEIHFKTLDVIDIPGCSGDINSR